MDDNKGQNNKSQIEKHEGGAPLDFFHNAPLFSFLFKKTEKVVTALYLVTGLLSDSEPIKWKVRSLGAEMLTLTNSLKDKFSAERDGVVHALKSHILEVSSLLDISKYAGLMSEMNAGILRDELSELGSVLERNDSFGISSGSLVMDHSFFSSEHAIDGNSDVRAVRREQAAFPKKDISLHAVPQGHKKSSQIAAAKNNSNNAESSKKTEKKGMRRDAILAIIRKKGEVTIKDISLTMHEVSEKTIQRELLSLIEGGVLKKEGERRWSRYSIKPSV